MLIIDHWLHNDDGSPIRRVESPNVGAAFAEGALQYLIMHYTAMASAEAAIHLGADRTASCCFREGG